MNGHDIEKDHPVGMSGHQHQSDAPCRHIGRFFFCTKAGIQGSQTSYPTRFSGGPVGACAEDWEKEYR
ncbi:hypothetical protein ABID47_004877 [Paenibacillus favisporus]|uniref:Uncharacterized protein n=1 Tax=Paenibacillus favisporus TaxID=221028 RepID=A0ABV2F9A5_9BACL